MKISLSCRQSGSTITHISTTRFSRAVRGELPLFPSGGPDVPPTPSLSETSFGLHRRERNVACSGTGPGPATRDVAIVATVATVATAISATAASETLWVLHCGENVRDAMCCLVSVSSQ